MMRIFVAVGIDAKVVDALSTLQNQLKETAPQLKWVNPDNFHLTVKFLGEIPESSIPVVSRALKSAVHLCEPFELTFAGVGLFGSEIRPKVIWIGIKQGANRLTELAGCVDRQLSEVGFALETRKYSAHVTLARSKKETKALSGSFRTIMRENSAAEFGSSQVNSVLVMQSELGHKDPKYSIIEEITLCGGAEQ